MIDGVNDEEVKRVLSEALSSGRARFGLGQQGHLPTIEKMLAKHQSWEAIGKAIGWCPNTACQHYANYLRAKVAALEETVKRLEEQINGL